jgi:hypothetical protein
MAVLAVFVLICLSSKNMVFVKNGLNLTMYVILNYSITDNHSNKLNQSRSELGNFEWSPEYIITGFTACIERDALTGCCSLIKTRIGWKKCLRPQ